MNVVERARYEREAEQQHQERRADARERRAAGMGFWRLVMVIAFGILLSRAMSGLLLAAWTFIQRLAPQ